MYTGATAITVDVKNNMSFLTRLFISLLLGLSAILVLFFAYYFIFRNAPNGIALDIIRIAGFGLAMWCYFSRREKDSSPPKF